MYTSNNLNTDFNFKEFLTNLTQGGVWNLTKLLQINTHRKIINSYSNCFGEKMETVEGKENEELEIGNWLNAVG